MALFFRPAIASHLLEESLIFLLSFVVLLPFFEILSLSLYLDPPTKNSQDDDQEC